MEKLDETLEGTREVFMRAEVNGKIVTGKGGIDLIMNWIGENSPLVFEIYQDRPNFDPDNLVFWYDPQKRGYWAQRAANDRKIKSKETSLPLQPFTNSKSLEKYNMPSNIKTGMRIGKNDYADQKVSQVGLSETSELDETNQWMKNNPIIPDNNMKESKLSLNRLVIEEQNLPAQTQDTETDKKPENECSMGECNAKKKKFKISEAQLAMINEIQNLQEEIRKLNNKNLLY